MKKESTSSIQYNMYNILYKTMIGQHTEYSYIRVTLYIVWRCAFLVDKKAFFSLHFGISYSCLIAITICRKIICSSCFSSYVSDCTVYIFQHHFEHHFDYFWTSLWLFCAVPYEALCRRDLGGLRIRHLSAAGIYGQWMCSSRSTLLSRTCAQWIGMEWLGWHLTTVDHTEKTLRRRRRHIEKTLRRQFEKTLRRH